ncbi:rod shape-determining protein MreC [Thermomicrobium sp. 4228-Ro]|uniref:rod shape-determining protein MreC n=1 Tax=Thermomicrobium sp. 4228-Ro TaxID=2993937 RepID=UPI002248DCF2|nr:rod shape-determining protein MreC [Thermomicrobium sp. 4228-Ro]MCX2727259.1 rod shape-determining protein MreC [Thermomicrobium sp. 4228-Ro]
MPITLRRTAILALGLVVASLLFIVSDRQQHLAPFQAPITGLLVDLERGIRSLTDGLPLPSFSSQQDLQREIERLRAERDALLAQLAEARRAQQELEQLRAQLQFQQAHPGLQLVAARVIGYDPEQPQRVLVIDRGSDDGVRVGMAVLNPNVLVGLVTRVESHRAQVTLLTDPSIQLGAQLLDSGAEGIVYGRGWHGRGLLELRHLPPDTPFREGELVVTSGRTVGIPAGLVIGVAVGGTRQAAEDELRVSVRPLVDVRSLTTVSVLVGTAEGHE